MLLAVTTYSFSFLTFVAVDVEASSYSTETCYCCIPNSDLLVASVNYFKPPRHGQVFHLPESKPIGTHEAAAENWDLEWDLWPSGKLSKFYNHSNKIAGCCNKIRYELFSIEQEKEREKSKWRSNESSRVEDADLRRWLYLARWFEGDFFGVMGLGWGRDHDRVNLLLLELCPGLHWQVAILVISFLAIIGTGTTYLW